MSHFKDGDLEGKLNTHLLVRSESLLFWKTFLVTSQRGSAWQCYVGRWPRETCVFPPVGLENPMEILKPILKQVVTLVRPTNTPNLVENGSQGAPPHRGEISHSCDFCSPFFFFFFSVSSSRLQVAILNRFTRLIAQTTCSDLYTCLLAGLEPSNSLLGGLTPKKHQNFDPFSDFADLQRKLLQH